MAIFINKKGEAALINPTTGQSVWVAEEDVDTALKSGYGIEDYEIARKKDEAEEYDKPIETAILTAGTSALLGAPVIGAALAPKIEPYAEDVLGKFLSPDEDVGEILTPEIDEGVDFTKPFEEKYPEKGMETGAGLQHYQKMIEQSPVAAAVGSTVGALASAMVPISPLAKAGVIGKAIGEKTVPSAIGRMVGEGVTTGAALGVVDELQRQAIADKYSATDIAKSAVVDGVIGGIFSLGIAGITTGVKKASSAIMEKQYKKITEEAAKKTEIESLKKQLNTLQSNVDLEKGTHLEFSKDAQIARRQLSDITEEIAKKELAFSESYKMKPDRTDFGIQKLFNEKGKINKKLKFLNNEADVAQQSVIKLNKEIDDINNVINASTKEHAKKTGLGMKSVLAATGASVGAAMFDNFALGLIGGTLAAPVLNVGKKIIGRYTSGLPSEIIGKTANKINNLMSWESIKSIKIVPLSNEAIKQINNNISMISPKDTYESYYKGYREADIPNEVADKMARFQQNRINHIKEKIDLKKTNIEISNLINAYEDPRRILARINKSEATKEDIEVLKRNFSETYEKLKKIAKQELIDGNEWNYKKRNQLNLIANYFGPGKLIQESFHVEDDEKTQIRKLGRTWKTMDETTGIQRIQEKRG